MSAFSPSAFLLWAILACLFQAFLVVHLWCYDRFQCIKWGSGRQPGAFKRVMTYSYLATLPMLMIFSVGMAILSYQEGWIILPPAEGVRVKQSLDLDPYSDDHPMLPIIPKPFSLYTHSHKKLLLPMYFLLAFAWALELVTHLEELTFWLFLLHQGPTKRDWFHSWEFRAWSFGSMAAILGMPIAVLVRRDNYDSCIAWILFSGSSAGTVTTISFIYVLLRFPDFIRRVKAEGAEPDVVVRLATFYQLNIIRIVFRFLFNFTLLTLALDGIQGTHAIARTVAASDVLSMLGGIGCFVSSAITLLIFFPRSITRESGYKAKLSSSPSVEDPDGERLASPLPHYSRHARNASSPKSPPATADGRWAQSPQMGPFRLTNGNGSDYSLGSYNANHRPARTASYPSHRRYSSDGEATPGYYESDPEVTARRYSSRRRKANYGGGGGGGVDDQAGGDEVIWEMQRPEEMVAAYRRRRPHSRPPSQGDHHSEGAPPSFDHHDSFKGNHDREREEDGLKGNANNHDSAVVILPSEGPILAMEEGMTFPSLSHRSSFVHPYVMNFTSPIDLLDATDKDNNSIRPS